MLDSKLQQLLRAEEEGNDVVNRARAQHHKALDKAQEEADKEVSSYRSQCLRDLEAKRNHAGDEVAYYNKERDLEVEAEVAELRRAAKRSYADVSSLLTDSVMSASLVLSRNAKAGLAAGSHSARSAFILSLYEDESQRMRTSRTSSTIGRRRTNQKSFADVDHAGMQQRPCCDGVMEYSPTRREHEGGWAPDGSRRVSVGEQVANDRRRSGALNQTMSGAEAAASRKGSAKKKKRRSFLCFGSKS